MKCSAVRDKLMAYEASELLPAEAHRIDEHLAGCVECRARMQVARRASDALSLLGVQGSTPDILGGVRARLDREATSRRPVLFPRLAVAFSVLVLLAVTAVWFRQTPTARISGPTATRPADTSVQSGVKPVPPQLPGNVGMADHQAAPDEPTPAVPDKTAPALKNPRPVFRPMLADDRPYRRREERTAPQPVAPEPLVAEEPDSGDPAMIIVLEPREPEEYMIKVNSEDDAPVSELRVIREYDAGGNVKAVTINQKESIESPDTNAPGQGASRPIDIHPVYRTWAGWSDLRGNSNNV